MSAIAQTPPPPYYAVIFTSIHTDSSEGYSAMAEKMLKLAAAQPGFLGVESTGGDIGITVSYWSDLTAIKQWKSNSVHQQAQQLGKEKWYANYKVRISRVDRDYGL